jgi:hypothetical protein
MHGWIWACSLRLETHRMTGTAANSNWCEECRRHKTVCECDPPVNIYLVEYKLITDSVSQYSRYEGKVRCIAYDPFQAMSKIQAWILITDYLWLAVDEEATEDYKLPIGDRDLTIKSVELYAENVGEMLKAYPLPEIFEQE